MTALINQEHPIFIMLKTFQKYGKLLLMGTVDIAIGVGLFFPFMAGYSYALMHVVGAGLAFVVTRAGILAVIPFILRHTDLFLDIINVTIVFADIFIDVLIFIIDIVTNYLHDIIDIVNDASKILGAGKLPFNIPALSIHFITIETVSRHAFKRFLLHIETTCPAYDSSNRIFYFITRNIFNKFSCPLVRYMYPIQWIYDLLESMLSWSYHGSAAPLVDTVDANCGGGDYGTSDYICITLGTGFFILETLVPMLLMFVLLLLIGKGLISLFRVAIFLMLKCLQIIKFIAVVIVKFAENDLIHLPFKIGTLVVRGIFILIAVPGKVVQHFKNK